MSEKVRREADGYPCWVDLSVPNVDAAVIFYGNVLGWRFSETGPEYGGYQMASLDGVQAAGIGPQEGKNPSYWVLYFATGDVEATVAKARDLGGSIFVEPFDVATQGRMAIVADPTGAMFGLWQGREHHGFGASERPGFFTWAEVNTRDADKARDFYSELLDATHAETQGTGTTYFSLMKDGKAIGGILQMNEQWEGIPPHWMVYFEVADISAAAAAAKEHGGSVAVEPFDTPFGRIAVVGDPAMAPFSLLQRLAVPETNS